jgi:hypothetical protein
MHAVLGLTDLTPIDQASLALTGAESRTLCEAADTHLSEDGLRLQFVDVNTWLLASSDPVDVLTERPDWLTGEPIRPNLPRGRQSRLVERWMNELQVLLFAHPINASREDRALPTINTVWLWGFGPPSINAARAQTTRSQWLALRTGDAAGWQKAWADLTPDIVSTRTLILGDSRPRFQLRARKPSAATRFTSLFQRSPVLADVLTDLQQRS